MSLVTMKSLLERAEALPKRSMEDFLNGIVPRRLGQTLAKAAGMKYINGQNTVTCDIVLPCHKLHKNDTKGLTP